MPALVMQRGMHHINKHCHGGGTQADAQCHEDACGGENLRSGQQGVRSAAQSLASEHTGK